MQYRIRGAALIVRERRILLVQHRDPVLGTTWWCPPGGLEGDETILECVRREVWEETGLSVELGNVVYVREFVESARGVHHLELFFTATGFSGQIALGNFVGKSDEQYIKDARFLSIDEIQPLIVYPEILKEEFWSDLDAGPRGATYLGSQRT